MMVRPPRYLLSASLTCARHFHYSIKGESERENVQIPFSSVHFVERILFIDRNGIENK